VLAASLPAQRAAAHARNRSKNRAPQPVTEAAKFGGHRNGELGGSLPTAVSRTVSWFSERLAVDSIVAAS